MPTVAEIGTNFNLPNFHGRVHQQTPSDTPFYTMLQNAAVGGGQVAVARTFEWQTYDLRSAGQNTRTDAADAPSAENRRRSNVFNVLQTHAETVGVGWERLAQTGQFNVPGDSSLDAQNIDQGANPISSEHLWQIMQMWKQIARDKEYSLIRGEYQLPSDDSTAAQTRGISEAIDTNEVDADGEPLDDILLGRAMQMAWDEGGLQEGDMRLLLVPSVHKRQLSQALRDLGVEPRSRTVLGVNVQTVETDFGELNVALNRHVEDGEALIVSLEQCQPWYRLIPDRGIEFAMPLPVDGARDQTMLYCSLGLEYGNELAHAKVTGLSTDNPGETTAE